MGKNFNGTQINQSPTISEKAGADVADIRNLILKYDTDGTSLHGICLETDRCFRF